MRLLLDTHALLWWQSGSRKLGRRARRAIEQDASAVYVSAAVVWEIAIKSSVGRLRLPRPLHVWIPEVIAIAGFGLLAISVDHAVAVPSLPDHHPDPFDRLLIAQARSEDLTIVTADAAFADYDVRVLDAAE